MKTQICFVGPDNYPVLNPSMGNRYIGGESVQQTLLARAFSEAGYTVSMIVKDFGQANGEVLNRIQVWKTFEEGSGIPILRFIHPKITSILRALKNADADIYYQSCAGFETGVVAWFCKRYDKKFVYRVASDTNCIPGQQRIRFWRDKKIYEYGLKRSALIISQTDKQVELLRDNYGLKSIRINMLVELPGEAEETRKDIDILWVNNIRPVKRPELVIELAKRLPEYRVVAIGGPCGDQKTYYNEIKTKATALDNLKFMGFIPYRDVNQYYSRARVFVNTSELEGFPNSFLQAWIRGVPVISFFDPDNLIRKQELGGAPANLDEMVELVKDLMLNKPYRHSIAKRTRAFAFEHYSPRRVIQEYASVFSKEFGA